MIKKRVATLGATLLYLKFKRYQSIGSGSRIPAQNTLASGCPEFGTKFIIR
jgi:hypothetical protein